MGRVINGRSSGSKIGGGLLISELATCHSKLRANLCDSIMIGV